MMIPSGYHGGRINKMIKDKSHAIRKLLILHEGLKYKPYQCTAGKFTIGVGRNLDDVGIDRKEAMMMLDHDIERACYDLHSIFGDGSDMDSTRQVALVDMIFNLGKTRFLGFKKFIKAVQGKDWARAAMEMENSRWFRQVGTRAVRLKDMILYGDKDIWSSDYLG